MDEIKIIEKMQVRQTTDRLWCGWTSTSYADVTSTLAVHLTQENYVRRKFILSAEARVEFWCADGDQGRALSDAKHGLARTLHAPLFGLTDRMRRAVHKADEKEMLALCDEMDLQMGVRP